MNGAPPPRPKTPPRPSLSLREIPGLADLLEHTREVETASREEAWIGVSHRVAGFTLRVMTVEDYTILLQFENPLLNRKMPSIEQLAFFLWVLSPEMALWSERSGWRRWLGFRWVEKWQSHRHGKKVRTRLHIAQLEKDSAEWSDKAKNVPFEITDNAPFAQAIKDALQYVDDMFMDRPAALKSDGPKSGLCYLTSWFDMLQSEYHMPTEEVWKMRLPVLFARIKAIQRRYNKNLPDGNNDRDRILQNIMTGLRENRYTLEDLKSGRVDLLKNCLLNN